jgi:5S rRNA maturation endonuclease (ribonuclease M5)
MKKYFPLLEEHRLWLKERRCLSNETIERVGILYTQISGNEYLAIPNAWKEGKVISYKLRIAEGFPYEEGQKWKFDPKKINPVFGKEFWLESEPKTVYLCEGELDCLLLNQHGFAALTSTTGVKSTIACLNQLPSTIETIILATDHDDAGREAIPKVSAAILQRWPHVKIRTISWPEEMPKGSDVTNIGLIGREQESPFGEMLLSMLHDVNIDDLEDQKKTWTQTPSTPDVPINEPVNLEDVLRRTRKIGFSQDYLVETLLATFVSKEVDKHRPLWLLVVGNPSSNKTVGISLVRDPAEQESFMLDVMTSNPFISGMSPKEKPKDLLPHLNGKCFMLKDYTAFFGRSEETVKQLLSDMVAIYDGEYSKHSGSRGTIRYKVSFSHIGAITPLGLQKRQQYMNMIGPRFLILRIPELTDEEHEKGFEIAWADDLDFMFSEASRYARHFVKILCQGLREQKIKVPTVPKNVQGEINLLAKLISHTRGIVHSTAQKFENENGEERTYQEVEEIQREEPFRALHQLKVLCRCLAIIREKNEVTMEEVKTARLVALSSMPVHRAEVLAVFEKQLKVTAKQAADLLGKNYKTAKRHLDELFHLGVLTREKEDAGFDNFAVESDEIGANDTRAWVYKPHTRFEKLIHPQSDVL